MACSTTKGAFALPSVLVVGSLLGSMIVGFKAPATGPVAVLFPPWWNAARSVQAAASAGAVVRFGIFPFVVVIVPDAADSALRLARAGAWLSLDPTALGGCTGP